MKKLIEFVTRNNSFIEYFYKIVSIIGFTFVILTLLMIQNEPAAGYEPSIYTAVSSLIWILLILSITCGLCIIAYWLFKDKYEKSNWWFIGLFLLIFNNIIILLLPSIRGYAAYGREDHLSHLGHVINIINLGHISDSNIYPISHILIAMVENITGIPPLVIGNYTQIIFMLLYILSIYLLAKVTLNDIKMVRLAVISATMLNISSFTWLVPWGLAALMIPLPIYLFIKDGIEYKILLIILMIMYPFFHPLSAFILIICFISMILLEKIYMKMCHNFFFTPDKTSLTFNTVIISSTIFLGWLMDHYSFWRQNIIHFSNVFIGEEASPKLIQYSTKTFENIDFQFFDIIALFLKIYGSIMIYIMLSIISIVIIIKKVRYGNIRAKNLFVLIACFVIPSLIEVLNIITSLFFSFTLRILRFALEVTPVFIGFILFEISERFKNRYKIVNASFLPIGMLVIVLLIMVPSIIGIFNTYSSSYTSSPNYQVTFQEMDGMKWFFENNNKNIGTYNIKTYIYRFSDAFFGFLNYHYSPLGQIQDHFGNINNVSSDQKYKGDAYLLTSKYDITFYTEIYPKINDFNNSDFEKLNFDPTANKLYSNRELEVWLIHNITLG